MSRKLETVQAEIRRQDEVVKKIIAKAKADGREIELDASGEAIASAPKIDSMELAAMNQAFGTIRALKAEVDRVMKEQPALPQGELEEIHAEGATDSGTRMASRNEGVPGKASWRDIMGRAPSASVADGNLRMVQRMIEAKDPRLFQPRASMVEAVPSSGGFLIGETNEAAILDASLPAEIVRPRASVYGITAGDVLNIPGWDDGDRSSTVFGGVNWQWVPESGTITPTDPKARRVKLTCHKVVIDAKTSSELREDLQTGNIANPIESMLSTVAGYMMDNAFLTGDGAGKPLGILNAPCLVVVPGEGGQTADTVRWINCLKLFARNSNPMNSVWICNPTVIPSLMQMTITGGEGAFPVPVMNTTGGLSLLTRPLLLSEHLPVVGDEGCIIFVDLSQYAILIRAGITLLTSTGAYWATDEVGIRVRMRIDGQPLLDAPITPRKGSTVSPFVALGAVA
jgi:HK97 family phage major capsid protein